VLGCGHCCGAFVLFLVTVCTHFCLVAVNIGICMLTTWATGPLCKVLPLIGFSDATTMPLPSCRTLPCCRNLRHQSIHRLSVNSMSTFANCGCQHDASCACTEAGHCVCDRNKRLDSLCAKCLRMRMSETQCFEIQFFRL